MKFQTMEQMRRVYEALDTYFVVHILFQTRKNVEMTTLPHRQIPPVRQFRPALDDCD